MDDLIALALEIAAKAHGSTYRKACHELYIMHPLRVASKMEEPMTEIAAILHDVVEDTIVTLDYLRGAGIPEEAVEIIDFVSRRKGETYRDFIGRVSSHPGARKVKIADIRDNMNDIPAEMAGIEKRYAKALEVLHG